MKVPVSLIIDDPAPIISVYYEHAGKETTGDGRPLVPTYPNKMLFEFCDIVEKRGIRGKYSVIPMPGNKGDIINGLEGVSKEALDEWLNTVKTRLCPNFTIGPEMLTHHKAVDLETGKALPMNERDFAATQNRETLTPYIEKAVSLLNHAGFDAFGISALKLKRIIRRRFPKPFIKQPERKIRGCFFAVFGIPRTPSRGSDTRKTDEPLSAFPLPLKTTSGRPLIRPKRRMHM